MTITLNGSRRDVSQAQTVEELVAELNLPRQVLLIEHNGVALRRDEWSAAHLAEGDRVEIIRIVAGG